MPLHTVVNEIVEEEKIHRQTTVKESLYHILEIEIEKLRYTNNIANKWATIICYTYTAKTSTGRMKTNKPTRQKKKQS